MICKSNSASHISSDGLARQNENPRSAYRSRLSTVFFSCHVKALDPMRSDERPRLSTIIESGDSVISDVSQTSYLSETEPDNESVIRSGNYPKLARAVSKSLQQYFSSILLDSLNRNLNEYIDLNRKHFHRRADGLKSLSVKRSVFLCDDLLSKLSYTLIARYKPISELPEHRAGGEKAVRGLAEDASQVLNLALDRFVESYPREKYQRQNIDLDYFFFTAMSNTDRIGCELDIEEALLAHYRSQNISEC